MKQQIRFAKASDGVSIAYATVGSGPPLVKAPNWLSHLEYEWDSPIWRHWWEELTKTHLLVRFDQRGGGLSDWSVEDVSLDTRIGDLECVVEAVGLDRFALLGISQGGAISAAYAERHPDKVTQLILYGSYPRGSTKRAKTPEETEEIEALMTLTRRGWGRDDPTYRQIFTSGFIPDATPEQMDWFNELQRVSTSPEGAYQLMVESGNVDVRNILPNVQPPTLVLHSRGDRRVPFDEGRQLAAMIPNAEFVPLESNNHMLLESEPAWPKFLSEVRRFLGVSPQIDTSLTKIAIETSSQTTRARSDLKRDIFISYVEEDSSVATKVGDGLESAGYSTWLYERDSLPGPAYLLQMGDAIDNAQAIVIVISQDSMASNQVTTEVVRAHEGAKPFIPLLHGVTQTEFQQGQPLWRQAIGAATSIAVDEANIAALADRIVQGLGAMGIQPGQTLDVPLVETRPDQA